MKRYLIVNADDFGLTEGVTRGILAAHHEGIVSSTTLMVNMPYAEQAFALAKENPSLGVGLHFVLTAGHPLAEGVDSLTDSEGRFLKLSDLQRQAQPEHLERELRAQLDAFLQSGLVPTHFDSHHHACGYLPAAEAVMLELAAELGVPVRHAAPQRAQLQAKGVRGTHHFLHGFYGEGQIGVEQLLATLEGLEPGVTELMCHPGYVDHHLMRMSSYNLQRLTELLTLTDPQVQAALAALEIELVNYGTEAVPLV